MSKITVEEQVKAKKRKTYAEDFFEKFPNAKPRYEDGKDPLYREPYACREHLYGTKGKQCDGIICNCVGCWNEEMEDEDERS